MRSHFDADARRERHDEHRERTVHERERAAREVLALRKVTVIDTRKVGELFERGLARLGVLEGLRTLEALLWEEAFVYPVGLSEAEPLRERLFVDEARSRERRSAGGRGRSRHARFADG